MNHLRSPGRPLVVAALSLLLCASCGGPGPKLHPVRGKVTFDGQPAVGATVVLHPTNADVSAAKPSGVVGAGGEYTLATHPHGAGAPAGEYLVVVSWYPPDARQAENPRNKLPARYADPTRTPFPKVTIKPGRNELEPLNLKSK